MKKYVQVEKNQVFTQKCFHSKIDGPNSANCGESFTV